jgi:hypothetical protein
VSWFKGKRKWHPVYIELHDGEVTEGRVTMATGGEVIVDRGIRLMMANLDGTFPGTTYHKRWFPR